MSLPHRTVSGTVVAVSVLVAGCGEAPLETCETLSMDLAWGHTLPTDFALGGAWLGDDGVGLVWSSAGDRVLRVDSDHVLDVTPTGSGIVIGAHFVPTGLQVVRAAPPQVVTVDVDGSIHVDPLELPISPEVAVPTKRGWAMLGPALDVANQLVADVRSTAGGWETAATMDMPGTSDSEARAWLSASDESIYLSGSDRPFAVEHTELGGGDARSFQPPDSILQGLEAGTRGPRWFGLRALDLGESGGVVQTLVDLRSDLRIVLRYDPLGTLVSRSDVQAPLAFIAASANGHVLATRRIEGLEVVLYRWSCQAPPV